MSDTEEKEKMAQTKTPSCEKYTQRHAWRIHSREIRRKGGEVQGVGGQTLLHPSQPRDPL